MEAHHQDHDQDDYNSSIMDQDSRNMIMIKGKRTKRPRPSSPLALTMASTSSTTTTTTTTGATSEDTDINPNDFFHIPTTTTSIEFTKIPQEHDDEDMANCLILLAQGQANNSPSSPPPNKAGLVAGAEVQGAGASRTSGFYVYECKTCNRGFSSFQALGGHRASHKKPPKPTIEDKIRPNIVKQDVGVHHTTLSLQIGSNHQTHCNNPSGSMIKPAKVHECSICGAEFGSGQALGGHMRRHRSMPMANTTTCSNSSSGRCHQDSKKPKTLLSLDLNLPAPVEDVDHRETKFPFRSKDQMIVFSNSSLVHCRF